MIDEGLDRGQPKYRLIQLSDALLRDCRLIASIKMHTGRDDAEAGDDDDAEQVLRTRPRRRPAKPARHRRSRLLLLHAGQAGDPEAARRPEKKEGKAFNLTKFHDAFLNAGLVPVSIIRREMGVKGPAL